MCEVLIVLGGGVNNKLPFWTINRCDYVIDYYKRNKNIKIIATSGGTFHCPNPLDEHGFTIHECDLITQYLINNGIPDDLIIKEWCSYDTIGNAYFSKLLLIDVFKWYNMKVITSDFHMPRSKAIFDYIFRDTKYNLEYIEIKYIDDKNLINISKRIDKEQKSLEKFNVMINQNDFDLDKWIYTEHQCYVSNPKEKKVFMPDLLYC